MGRRRAATIFDAVALMLKDIIDSYNDFHLADYLPR